MSRLRRGGGSRPSLVATAPAASKVNGLETHVLVAPTDAHPAANAITIKRPSSTATGWGNKTLPYGSGQALELLSDSATDPALNTDPTNPVLFRLDSFGGIGVCHGAHIATGLREQSDSTPPTQGIWVDPSIDCVGLVMDNPTPTEVPTTPTADFLLIRDVRPATAYNLVRVTADGTIVAGKAVSITSRLGTDIPLTIQTGVVGAGHTADLFRVFDRDGKKRLIAKPQDGTITGFADDGTTAAFTLTPADAGNAGYRSIIAAVNVNTIGMGITSPASYTKDHLQVIPSGGVKFRVDKAGRIVTKLNAAPALADLSDGEATIWLDTVGNAFKISARIAGVLRTGTVAVA